MPMTFRAEGVRPVDERYKKMEAVYNACKEASVPAPDAVSMFFNFRPPSGDVRVDIDEAIETAEDEGYWLDLSKLPKEINKIKMYFT